MFSKRRIIKSLLNVNNSKRYLSRSNQYSEPSGCFTSFFMLIGNVVIWSIKIGFLPFTLIYYGYIKKKVRTNTKTFLKIIAFIVWAYWFYYVLISNYVGVEDVKFEDYSANLLFFVAPQIFMVISK